MAGWVVKVVSKAKMILWAYIFVVLSDHLNTMYKKQFFAKQKLHEIHKNLNRTKINNHWYSTTTEINTNYLKQA